MSAQTASQSPLEAERPLPRKALSRRAYERYAHSVRAAYHALKLVPKFDDQSLSMPSYEALVDLTPEARLRSTVDAMRSRLSRVDTRLPDQIFERPWLRLMSFHGRDALIPIVNEEGRGWYDESPMMNFDFYVETFCGMHNGAHTIYDIGGHQGVWALYYAMGVEPRGRVYTFEPSIVNVEVAALSFLLNDIENGIIVPFGIGETNETIRVDANGLLIAGVSHNVNIIRFDHVFWEKPDFIKIDIEGFEHELIRSFPDIFDFCKNMHLEVHVPHLNNRGIDYREIISKIPFHKVRVRRAEWGALTEIGPDDVLEGYCALMITPR